jgi:hypothetical protein
MSVRIIVPGAYQAGKGWLPKNRAGLVGCFVLGDSISDGVKNWAGGPDATVVGAPTASTGYLRLSQAAYMQTSVPETQDMTIITVSRYPNTWSGAALVCSNYDSPIDGVASYYSAANLFRFGARSTTGFNTVSSGAYDISKWKFFAGRCSGASSVAATLRRYDPGPNNDNNTIASPRQQNGKSLRIGAGYQSLSSAQIDVSLVLVYSRALSDDECDAVRTDVSPLLAARDITLG